MTCRGLGRPAVAGFVILLAGGTFSDLAARQAGPYFFAAGGTVTMKFFPRGGTIADFNTGPLPLPRWPTFTWVNWPSFYPGVFAQAATAVSVATDGLRYGIFIAPNTRLQQLVAPGVLSNPARLEIQGSAVFQIGPNPVPMHRFEWRWPIAVFVAPGFDSFAAYDITFTYSYFPPGGYRWLPITPYRIQDPTAPDFPQYGPSLHWSSARRGQFVTRQLYAGIQLTRPTPFFVGTPIPANSLFRVDFTNVFRVKGRVPVGPFGAVERNHDEYASGLSDANVFEIGGFGGGAQSADPGGEMGSPLTGLGSLPNDPSIPHLDTSALDLSPFGSPELPEPVDGQDSEYLLSHSEDGTPNFSPMIVDCPRHVTGDAGSLISFSVVGFDAELPNQTLTFALEDAPSGASINGGTGLFTWEPAIADTGIHTFRVRLRDSGNPPLQDVREVTVTVNGTNHAPVLSPLPDQEVEEGGVLSLAIPVSDADGDALTITILEGPVGMEVDSETREIRWETVEGDGPGRYLVRYRVTDDGTPPLWATDEFIVTVTEAPSAPYFDPPAQVYFAEPGQSLTVTLPAAADDDTRPSVPGVPDFGATQYLHYTLMGGLPPGLTFDPASRIMSWTPPLDSPDQDVTLMLEARDLSGLTGTLELKIVVKKVKVDKEPD